MAKLEIPGSVSYHKASGRHLARRNYKTADGESKVWSAYGATEKEAIEKLKAFNDSLIKGKPKTGKKELTLGDFLDFLFTKVYEPKLRPSTVRLYKGFAAHHLDSLKPLKLSKVTVQNVEQCINHPKLVRKNKEGNLIKPLSPQSKNLLRTFLAGVMNHAVRLGHIEVNPVLNAQVHERKPMRKVKALSVEAMKSLLEHAGSMRTGYLVQATTGLRVGEMLGLKWTDLDKDVLTVDRQVQRVDGKIVEQGLKTQDSHRHVILLKSVVEELAKLPKRGEYIFATESGKPMDPRNYNRSLEADSAKAGLEKVTSHMLRHTYSTLALKGGAELITISRALGHSSLAVTQIYAETSIETIRKATRAVGNQLLL
jgi:integrase